MSNKVFPTFESLTDMIRFTVRVNDGTGRVFCVASLDDGIRHVKKYLAIGVMSHVVIEQAFYSKWVYAMSYDGEWVYRYGIIWKQVN